MHGSSWWRRMRRASGRGVAMVSRARRLTCRLMGFSFLPRRWGSPSPGPAAGAGRRLPLEVSPPSHCRPARAHRRCRRSASFAGARLLLAADPEPATRPRHGHGRRHGRPIPTRTRTPSRTRSANLCVSSSPLLRSTHLSDVAPSSSHCSARTPSKGAPTSGPSTASGE